MQYAGRISSGANSQIKRLRAQLKANRRDAPYFLLEGLRLVQAALEAGKPPESIYTTETFIAHHAGLLERCNAAGSAVWVVSDDILNNLAETVTPQGILALAAKTAAEKDSLEQASIILVLDNLRDPGNVGTILRTAQAVAVDAVLFSPGCVHAYSSKVVRSAMGAHFTVPICECGSWQELYNLCSLQKRVLADADGAILIWEMSWQEPLALIISNEAFGPSPEARSLAMQTVRLPMAREAESLNAAVAASVILYEILRQRSCRGIP